MGRPVKILDHRAEMEYGNKYIFPLAQLFGFSFEGIENVPKKGYVIFYNNHGGWGAFDWIFLWTIIYNQLNEYLTGFINPILLKIPAIGPLLKTCGAVPIDKITDLKFLKKYARIYTIAPEGPEGTTKTFTESYRLYPFRPGFIKLGLKMRAHLVPMTMIGNEDVFPVMYRTNIIKKLIGTSLPIPFTLLPLPISRIRGRAHPGMDLSKYDPALSNDPVFCSKLAEKLRQEHQDRVIKEAKNQPFFKLNEFVNNIFGTNCWRKQKTSVVSGSKSKLKKR